MCIRDRRLPRAVGKAKAMDMCLTARNMDAQEAERAGLVSRVVPADKLMEEALAVAQKIAGYSLPVAMMIKESINCAYETALSEGCLLYTSDAADERSSVDLGGR